MVYSHRGLRRSNHLLKTGLALGSDTVAWALSSRAFKTSKDGTYATPLGSLFRCLPAFMEGKRFSSSAVWTSFVSTYTSSLSPSHHTLQWDPGSILSNPFIGVQAGYSVTTAPKPFLLQAEQVPVPQPLLTGKVLLWPVWGFPTELIPYASCLSCTGGAQNCIQCLKGVSQVLSRRG